MLLLLLTGARKNIEEAGSLHPMLLLEMEAERFMIPIEMADDSREKYQMFHALGEKMRLKYGLIQNAAVITESWIVMAKEAPDATKYMPSQHPCRQEAIVLIGRNADKTQSAIVIQTFTRNEHNAPVWSEPQVSISDSSTNGMVAEGLLDALFGN